MIMRISLYPVRLDTPVNLRVEGDTVVVNGEIFDFTPLGEGDTLPQGAILSDWFPGEVTRVGGKLHLTIRLPFGPNAPEATRFPRPITITKDGPVSLPVYDDPPTIEEPVVLPPEETGEPEVPNV